MREQVRDKIADALYIVVDEEGGSTERAVEVATDAVMLLVAPYVEALERVAPHEAELLDQQRLGRIAGQTTLLGGLPTS